MAREPKIYVLPNLMTAGNLFCGFMAVLTIFRGMATAETDPGLSHGLYHRSILFIFGACLFDLLDGRLARLGGRESPFGREFDSLADVVSFGMAPALLVYKVVLFELPREAGSFVAFLYLLCGTMRLARFNCLAAEAGEAVEEPAGASTEERVQTLKEFVGLPIPMAAATISSLTILMIWLAEGERELGNWKYLLAVLLAGLALLMMSHLSYPSFKKINWGSRASLPWVVLLFLVLVLTVRFYEWMPAVLCTAYVLYGFVRPWISQRMRTGIEAPFAEEEDNNTPGP